MMLRRKTPLRSRTPLRRKTHWEYQRKPLRKHGVIKQQRMQRYRAHLNSRYWATLRALAGQRDGLVCQDCGRTVPKRGWHLAHRTYKRFGHEWLSDVYVSCRDCNLKERASRAWYLGALFSPSTGGYYQ